MPKVLNCGLTYFGLNGKVNVIKITSNSIFLKILNLLHVFYYDTEIEFVVALLIQDMQRNDCKMLSNDLVFTKLLKCETPF